MIHLQKSHVQEGEQDNAVVNDHRKIFLIPIKRYKKNNLMKLSKISIFALIPNYKQYIINYSIVAKQKV